jgi:hypothetical protein
VHRCVAADLQRLIALCNHLAVALQQPTASLHSTSDKAPATAADTDIEFPDVSDWVIYCDSLPKRSWAQLGSLHDRLHDQGFFDIDQLTGGHISHSDLAQSLGIGMGIAALIVRYAEDNVVQVHAGTFKMNLA